MRSTLALGAILTALLAGLALGGQEPSTGAHGAFYEDVALDTSQVERGGDPVPVSANARGWLPDRDLRECKRIRDRLRLGLCRRVQVDLSDHGGREVMHAAVPFAILAIAILYVMWRES